MSHRVASVPESLPGFDDVRQGIDRCVDETFTGNNLKMYPKIFKNIRGIIFDCDGTLVESGMIYADAWAAGFETSGIKMDVDWYHPRNGLSEKVLMDEFEVMTGIMLDRALVVEIVRRTFLARIEALKEVEAVAGAARIACNLLPVAVASGGPAAIVLPSLRQVGLFELMDTIVTFDDVGVPKPAPDLFVEAGKRLGLRREHCLVVEDSPTGLLAAKTAGMTAICVHDVEAIGTLNAWLTSLAK